MMKRGQVTLFIILAIAIVAIAIILFFSFRDKIFIPSTIPKELMPVKQAVENCLKTTVDDAIYLVSLQGGYFTAPEKYILFFYTPVPYYYYKTNLVPPKYVVEQEISDYILFEIKDCINLSNFDLDIVSGRIEITTDLKDKITVYMKYPLAIYHQDSALRIENFSYTSNMPLNQVYSASYNFINDVQSTKTLSLNLLSELAKNNEFYVDFIPLQNQTYIISLNKTINQEQKLTFRFAIKLE